MDAISLTDTLAIIGVIVATIGLFALIAREIWKGSVSKRGALKQFGLVALFFLTVLALSAVLGYPTGKCQ